MFVAALIFSFGQASANAQSIYDKDENTFVKEFNNASKNLGFKIAELKQVDELNGGAVFSAKIEGFNGENDVFIATNAKGVISSFLLIADNKESAEKFFKSSVAVLQINATYKEGLEEAAMKTASNKDVKVSVNVGDGLKGKVYTVMFAK
jgi:hypothetical protein